MKVNIASAKALYIAAYYRPKEGDTESAGDLRHSLEFVSKTQGNVWILGDFNNPKFSWDANHVPSIKQGCSFTDMYDDFMSMLDDFGLVQMVTEPTRCENVLDLFLTSNHTLVQQIKILPGIADHEIMVADVNLKPQIGRQKPRNVPLYRKADWDGFRKYFSDFASDFIIDYENKTVEDLWNSFKSTINQGISKFIPIKKFGV